MRKRIVWIHRDFVPNAPEPNDGGKPKVAKAALKAEGQAMAGELEGFAVSVRREGRAMLADRLAEAARIMRKLS